MPYDGLVYVRLMQHLTTHDILDRIAKYLPEHEELYFKVLSALVRGDEFTSSIQFGNKFTWQFTTSHPYGLFFPEHELYELSQLLVGDQLV